MVISADPEAWTDVTRNDPIPPETPDEPTEGTIQDDGRCATCDCALRVGEYVRCRDHE